MPGFQINICNLLSVQEPGINAKFTYTTPNLFPLFQFGQEMGDVPKTLIGNISWQNRKIFFLIYTFQNCCISYGPLLQRTIHAFAKFRRHAHVIQTVKYSYVTSPVNEFNVSYLLWERDVSSYINLVCSCWLVESPWWLLFPFCPQNFGKVLGAYEWYFVCLWVQFFWGVSILISGGDFQTLMAIIKFTCTFLHSEVQCGLLKHCSYALSLFCALSVFYPSHLVKLFTT